jgi:16S rRNA (cytidine1402-2'-O)-methyltransferase
VGILYVVGAPAGDPDDLTLRARRILAEARLVVAERLESARRLLTHHGVATASSALAEQDAWLAALEAGDVALLLNAGAPGPSGPELALIRAAIERGWPVVPIPGPALSLTALVLSGLPADSFVYLGERHDLLRDMIGERRTLVLAVSPDQVDSLLAELRDILGERPLAQRPGVLVVGGAQDEPVRWDEARLRAEIHQALRRGLRVKETSQRLAEESGWPRREVYQLAVDLARSRADRRKTDVESK